MVDLQGKRNLLILSRSEKAVETLENEAAIVPDINDHVAEGYDRKSILAKSLRSMILMLKSHFMKLRPNKEILKVCARKYD